MGNCAPITQIKVCKLGKKYLVQNPNENEEQMYDFIAARDDGRLEIYSYQIGNPFPTLCFET